MLAFYVEESDVKIFMNKLFRENIFDSFEVREASVTSFVSFEISGMLSKDSLLSQPENKRRYYARWEELKPYVFSYIKGRSKPESIKIVFSGNAELVKNMHPNAAALFLNINYDSNILHFTTATSQKEFTLNKELDIKWEDYIKNFFNEIKISIKFE